MENKKYGRYGKICTAIGGVAIATAALTGMAGASTAGLDGLDKGFFYDANYNPNVQIAVGESASALDVIGGGNIAAAIGNLAYTTSAGGACTGQGVVKLAVKSWGLIGKYEKGNDAMDRAFYTSSGVNFDGAITYTHGKWKNYNIACQVQKSQAEFPMKEEMCNEICLLCYGICQEEIKHVNHKMEESVNVNANTIQYYEDGLGSSDSESLKMRVQGGSLSYSVKLDGIPTSTIKTTGFPANLIDSAYRGKALFMGNNDYYVRDLAASGPTLTLAKGKKLTLNTEGFSEDFKGYTFKVAGFLSASSEWGATVAGALITVQKPDGSTVTVQATKQQNARLPEGIELQVFNAQGVGGVAGQGAGYGTADLIVYDTTTERKLENNKKFEGWNVEILKDKCNAVNKDDYIGDAADKWCLTNLKLTLDDEQVLTPGDVIYFPTKAVKFTFEGYKTDNFKDIVCSGGDDQIKVTKSGDSKLMLSFTDKDGNRYNDVRLDQGKLNTGNLFMVQGKVYSYQELKTETVGSATTYKLIINDKFDSSDVEIVMTRSTGAVKGPGGSAMQYKTFTGKENNGKTTVDSILDGSGDYYSATWNGLNMVVKSGNLYILNPATNKLGVDPLVMGTVSSENIDHDDSDITIGAVQEDGVNDLNGDYQTNDVLITFVTGGVTTYLDFYDADCNANGTSKCKDARTSSDSNTGVTIKSGNVTTSMISTSDDNMLIAQTGGDKYTKNADKELREVKVCHPVTKVMPTYFIGTEKNETMQEISITADDIGKQKSAACCDFTVKAFTLSGNGNGVTTGSCASTKNVGKIVVSDKNADTTKNLIVVGGPAVNTLAADVTKDEISADADKYVIKKVGNKLIVAGWEAQDTNNAANKVIDWLMANAHA